MQAFFFVGWLLDLGSNTERQYRLPQEYGDASGQLKLAAACAEAGGDIDHRAGRVLLRDTKNRRDHKLLLSGQALKIAKRNCSGRMADEPLFTIVDARKTLNWINFARRASPEPRVCE